MNFFNNKTDEKLSLVVKLTINLKSLQNIIYYCCL